MTSFFGLDTGQALAESVNLMGWVIAWSPRRYFLPKLRGNLKLRSVLHQSSNGGFLEKKGVHLLNGVWLGFLVLLNGPQWDSLF